MDENAKKLLDCFLEIEESQYPERFQERVKERSNLVRKFIEEFGSDHVTVSNYTNLMLFSSSVTLDVYDNSKYPCSDIEIGLGSETYELWATRDYYTIANKTWKKIKQRFDFSKWIWIENTEGDEE